MFEDKIKQLRLDKGVTQSNIAKAIGVSPDIIGNYEQGTREPRNNIMWQKLAAYFGVSVDYLIDKNTDCGNFKNDCDKIIQENIIIKQENEMLKRKLQSIMEIINI